MFRSLVLFLFVCGHILLAKEYESQPYDHVYSRIKSRGKLIVAISNDYPPFHFNGKGVQIEMSNSLASFLGVKPQTKTYSAARSIQVVETKEVDISMAGIFRSLPRAKRVWFSKPYLWDRPAALVDKRFVPQKKFGDFFEETPIRSLSDLRKIKGISAVVVSGSIYEEDFSNIINSISPSTTIAMKSILKGGINTFIHDSIYLKYQLEMNPQIFSKYTLIEEQGYKEDFCIALPFGDIVLKNQVDIWILLMKQKNQFQDWLDSYLRPSKN